MTTLNDPKPVHRAPAIFLALLCLIVLAAPARAKDVRGEDALWRMLAEGGGVVALMRHAYAPGGSDPDNFKIGDCSTQRNLSDAGRAQARATGEVMRAKELKQLKLYTSQWCRCRETAELLGFGEPTEMPALNSLFSRPQNKERQVKELNRFISALPKDAPPHFMATHQMTIRALIGRGTRSGAIVLVKSDGKGGVEFLGAIDAQPIP